MTTLIHTPWYKQFWPWALMLGPFAVVVASLITLGLALYHPESLVVDDYYKEGKAVHLSLQRDREAQRLGLEARLQWQGEQVSISLTSKQGMVWPQQLQLLLSHPVDAGQDQRLLLQRVQADSAEGVAQARYAGVAAVTQDRVKYEFILQDLNAQWRVLSLGRGVLQRDVLLLPARL
jgi:hypothetical protein